MCGFLYCLVAYTLSMSNTEVIGNFYKLFFFSRFGWWYEYLHTTRRRIVLLFVCRLVFVFRVANSATSACRWICIVCCIRILFGNDYENKSKMTVWTAYYGPCSGHKQVERNLNRWKLRFEWIDNFFYFQIRWPWFQWNRPSVAASALLLQFYEIRFELVNTNRHSVLLVIFYPFAFF